MTRCCAGNLPSPCAALTSGRRWLHCPCALALWPPWCTAAPAQLAAIAMAAAAAAAAAVAIMEVVLLVAVLVVVLVLLVHWLQGGRSACACAW